MKKFLLTTGVITSTVVVVSAVVVCEINSNTSKNNPINVNAKHSIQTKEETGVPPLKETAENNSEILSGHKQRKEDTPKKFLTPPLPMVVPESTELIKPPLKQEPIETIQRKEDTPKKFLTPPLPMVVSELTELIEPPLKQEVVETRQRKKDSPKKFLSPTPLVKPMVVPDFSQTPNTTNMASLPLTSYLVEFTTNSLKPNSYINEYFNIKNYITIMKMELIPPVIGNKIPPVPPLYPPHIPEITTQYVLPSPMPVIPYQEIYIINYCGVEDL